MQKHDAPVKIDQIELWTDGGPESEHLRRRLDRFRIPYRETRVTGENAPALNFGGTVYASRDGINLIISTLLGVE